MMLVTAETVTDEQIVDLRRYAERLVGKQWPNEESAELLFITGAALHRNLDQADGDGTWIKWRAACADAINARAAKLDPAMDALAKRTADQFRADLAERDAARAKEIADMPDSQRHKLLTDGEWRGWLWWLHDRSENCKPRKPGVEVGAEAARFVLARDEAERKARP